MKENINFQFGQQVAQLRRDLGLTQEDLADRCNIHRTYMGAIERGEKSPTLNTLEKIATGLSVSIGELTANL